MNSLIRVFTTVVLLAASTNVFASTETCTDAERSALFAKLQKSETDLMKINKIVENKCGPRAHRRHRGGKSSSYNCTINGEARPFSECEALSVKRSRNTHDAKTGSSEASEQPSSFEEDEKDAISNGLRFLEGLNNIFLDGTERIAKICEEHPEACSEEETEE